MHHNCLPHLKAVLFALLIAHAGRCEPVNTTNPEQAGTVQGAAAAPYYPQPFLPQQPSYYPHNSNYPGSAVAGGHQQGTLPCIYSCGTSRTVTVTCIMDPVLRQVLDVVLEDADGVKSSVCNVKQQTGMTQQTFHLPPGDNVYGVQACYLADQLVGLVFSSAGGPLLCGDPYNQEAVCRSTVVNDPAPMAAMYATCGDKGIQQITRVCFNANYINPIIPVTSCPPGQGRVDPDEPCRPCPRNFYNPGGLQAECLPCPKGLVTVSTGSSQCGCPPGYGANPDTTVTDKPCVLCSPGTYYPGGGLQPCWRCRGSAFLTTQPGASSIVQCVCRPGYGGISNCMPCAKGTFSNSLLEVIPQEPLDSLVRVPPGTGKGKGKGGCYTCNPSYKVCTPCCEVSVIHACNLTTATPQSTSFADCIKPPV